MHPLIHRTTLVRGRVRKPAVQLPNSAPAPVLAAKAHTQWRKTADSKGGERDEESLFSASASSPSARDVNPQLRKPFNPITGLKSSPKPGSCYHQGGGRGRRGWSRRGAGPARPRANRRSQPQARGWKAGCWVLWRRWGWAVGCGAGWVGGQYQGGAVPALEVRSEGLQVRVYF